MISVIHFISRFLLVSFCLMTLQIGCMPAKDMLPWEKYSPEVLDEAASSGEPVLIDFFAEWCIPCHDLEHYTYSNPQVKDELMRFRRIKVDVTDPMDPNIQEISQRFGVEGVPFIVFLDSQGNEVEEARISGFIAPRAMIDILKLPQFQQEPKMS